MLLNVTPSDFCCNRIKTQAVNRTLQCKVTLISSGTGGNSKRTVSMKTLYLKKIKFKKHLYVSAAICHLQTITEPDDEQQLGKV